MQTWQGTVPENNKVLFIFTNLELKELLNCSEHKVISIKKQLEEFGLLRQESVGFDPKQKRICLIGVI